MVITIHKAAGPNLMSSAEIPHELEHEVSAHTCVLGTASDTPLRVTGTIVLDITIGDQTVPVQLNITPRLVVPALLGTSFHRRNMDSINPQSRAITRTDSRPVAFLDKKKKNDRTVPVDDEDNARDEETPPVLAIPHDLMKNDDMVDRDARSRKIPPNSEATVLVNGPLTGQNIIESNEDRSSP